MSCNPRERDQIGKMVFGALDTNGDGTVDAREWAAAKRRLRQGYSPGEYSDDGTEEDPRAGAV